LIETPCRTDARFASTPLERVFLQRNGKYMFGSGLGQERYLFFWNFIITHSQQKIINGGQDGQCAGSRTNHQAAGRSWKEEAPPKTSEGSTRGFRSS